MSSRRRFLHGTAMGALAATLPHRAIDGDAVPGGSGSLQPPTAEADSDVGSLYPFIASQAVKGEFPLSFLQSGFTDLAAWKRDGRRLVLDLLHYAPPPCDPRPETVARVDRGAYIRETVRFNTTPDLRVPAFLLIPKGRRLPAPAIVALHDHGGFYLWGKEKLVESDGEHPVLSEFKRESYAGASIASELARRGFVVLVIDMFYWGERRLLLSADPADWRERPPTITRERIAAFNRRASENEQLVGRTILAAGFTWAGVMLWDDIRSVDYLASRPEVDRSRIGCVGLSVGALRSAHLAALDDRIKAAVVVCWMASFPSQLRRHVTNTIGHTKLIPGLYRRMDYPDVVSLAMPTPLLVINGSRDSLFEPSGLRASFRKLEDCYAKAGFPGRVRTRLYDTPHVFDTTMQAEAWSFLDEHLVGSRTR